MDKRLLDILCCPTTRAPLRLLSAAELEAVNQAIAAGQVRDESGRACAQVFGEALITRDGRTIYRIDDGIPVMLAEEAVATAAVEGFPRT
jgi:uncharacterized protein YbaR (Trm112 family)